MTLKKTNMYSNWNITTRWKYYMQYRQYISTVICVETKKKCKSLTSSLTISNRSLDCNAVLSNDKQKCMVSAGSVHSFNRDRVRTDSLDEPSTMQNWLKAGVFGLVRLHIENKGQFGVIVQTNLLQILLLAFLQWKINESEWKQVVFFFCCSLLEWMYSHVTSTWRTTFGPILTHLRKQSESVKFRTTGTPLNGLSMTFDL